MVASLRVVGVCSIGGFRRGCQGTRLGRGGLAYHNPSMCDILRLARPKRLVRHGRRGRITVNGETVTTLDLSHNMTHGSVSLFAGSSYYVRDYTMYFQDLILTPLGSGRV